MQNDHRFPSRRKPARSVHETHDGPTIAFVTVCTHQRRSWLATDLCHSALLEVWKRARGWLVGQYVVMPDHVHFFASPGEIDIDIELWVRYWKRLFAKHKPVGEDWQESQWHTRMRTAQDFAERSEYMRQNPVEKGLIASSVAWPYAGEVFEVRW